MDNGLGQPLIAVRVKDGIFVGNITAALDEDFLVMNKVTHIVNCCGTEVKDQFEDIGIEYLTFGWRDSPAAGGVGGGSASVMFDSADRNIEQVVRFVDQGQEGGNCVLIHSYFGANRSCALLAAYLIVKYGWKIDNTLAFISLAHSDMAIKPHFMRQLKQFARRHDVALDVFNKEVDDGKFALDNDQWMLRNTFLNGLATDTLSRNELYQEAVHNSVNVLEPNFKTSTKRRRRILFVDTKQGTGVGSNVSQPLAPSVTRHVDPHGANGASPRSPILSRRASPNSRRLESPSDVNPRGRLVLTPRRSRDSPVDQMKSGRQGGGNISEPEEPEDVEVHHHHQQQPGGYGGPGAGYGAGHVQHQHPIQQGASSYDRVQVPQQAPAPQLGSGGGGRTGGRDQQPSSANGRVGGPVRSPFALTYQGGGPARKGSPLPLQRQARRTTTSGPQAQQQDDAASARSGGASGGGASGGGGGYQIGAGTGRNPAVPSNYNQLQTQLRDPAQPQPRTSSPIKRQVGRADSPRGGPSRQDSLYQNRDRLASSGAGGGASSSSAGNRANSPMGSRLVFQSHPSIPNANATIVSNPNLRSTASVRPYGATSSPAAQQRTDSPMGRRTTQSPQVQRGGGPIENQLGRNSPRPTTNSAIGNRLSSPGGARQGSPQVRAGSPMSRSGGAGSAGATGGGGRPMSLADQYLSGGGGSQVRPRETTASLLRRQQNLSAHR